MLKMARLLTHPPLARPDAPCPRQGRRERRGEEVRTALRVGRSPLQWVLANGKAPTAFPISEKLRLKVEPMSDARTKLADFFSTLLQFDPESKHARIIVELFVADHCPEVHERLPAIGQDHQETGSKIEIIPNWNIILERELGRIVAAVLGELDIDKTLGVGKLMDVIRIKLRHQDSEAGAKCG